MKDYLKILIYKLEDYNLRLDPKLESKYSFKFWKPSIKCIVPPKKGKKYIIYWLFHLFRVFKNRDYSALLIYDHGSIIASLLIVPAHFKWPFMEHTDIQFTYVMTDPSYRGKGIGEMMIKTAIWELKNEKRKIWYVTDNKNIASMKLCAKVGFEFSGSGEIKGWGKYLSLN